MCGGKRRNAIFDGISVAAAATAHTPESETLIGASRSPSGAQNGLLSVLTNQRGQPYQSRLPDALIRFVFDAYLGEPQVDWSEQYLQSASAQNDQLQTQFDVFQAQRVAGAAPSLPLSRYTGTYSHSAFGELVISDEQDGPLNLTFQPSSSLSVCQRLN